MKKEELLKFYQNYRFYIFPVIVALSSLILIIFVIYPQTIKLLTNQKIGGEIAKKSVILETKAQTLENYDSGDLSAKVNSALSFYPSEKDLASIIGLLQDITAKSGFSITSLSLGGGLENKGLQSYGVKLDAVGPQKLMQNFLSNLEGSLRLIRISSLETSSAINQTIQASISLDVLYSSQTGDLGSIDSPVPQLSKEEEEVLARLAKVSPTTTTTTTVTTGQPQTQTQTQLGPRGKLNPFE